MLERMDFLMRLLRCSTEVTFTIPSIIFDESKDSKGYFEEQRRAYNILKKDNGLEVLEVPINPGTEDEELEITIKIGGMNG